ncbi:MAG: FKBP-type peptidyl-prolyl cis-trans isomerase [Bacteroidales bacterium]|nr:FKBP-type peptidyl-prolyl cis-trans isomerase [Bacteroidales bacterium]MDY0160873.1 FKBP-type peptidyl-prolyl cis-trans isomerase [Bacteroidales bacterium]
MKMISIHKTSISFLVLSIGILSMSCSCTGNRDSGNNKEQQAYSNVKTQYHKPLMEWNREAVAVDKDIIIKYAERRKWDITESGTGLYYDIYYEGNGTKAEAGDYAEFAYIISLLDGTELYNSDSTGTRKILLGHNNEEGGLDEALQMMNVGDKAHLILPPHLAFGVPGDGYLVPPRSILVYDIELVSINN